MKEEEIKKKAEEYESKFTYSLAIARHFEDGAKWALSQPQIIEIFGKRVKIVKTEDKKLRCEKCVFYNKNEIGLCLDSNGENNRYFVEVDEDGNEIQQ